MKCFSKLLLVSALLLVIFPRIVPAANLPTLPDSDKIKTGTLANGVRYYIVSNHTHKGAADIALVQKAGRADESADGKGEMTVQAMASLTDLQHFTMHTSSPFSYLRRNDLRPDAGGYVQVSEDATIFRFSNLLEARKPDIVDSTLLMVFDIIGRDNGQAEALYSPVNQAIIVSGDIDAGTVVGKMDMLSMLVTKKKGTPRPDTYRWTATRSSYEFSKGAASVTVELRSPRTPSEDMATVLPLVSSRYANELGIVLRRRISRALSASGTPYSDITFSYTGGSATSGDEVSSIVIHTSDKYLRKATRILAEVLSSLDEDGVTAGEYTEINNELSLQLLKEYGSPVVENARYVDKCIAAFLYGASLASDETNLDFFLDRRMDSGQSAKLFNNYISALIDKSYNMTVRCSTNAEENSEEAIIKAFNDGWKSNGGRMRLASADSTKLKKANGKLKIKAENPEPLFGGKMMTYANGIKVIYLKAPSKGMFNYAWLLKGGYGTMTDLAAGEGAYIGDMLGLYKVAGMSGGEFADMLECNGISMQTDVSISGLSITGSAKSDKLQLLMKSLLALTSDRHLDQNAYDYYRRCRDLTDYGRDMHSRLDSLMTKDLAYSPYKRNIRLADDLPKRAAKYYDNAFGKMNDGVLIIIGDVPEESVRKTMSQYLGSFRTDKGFAFRSRVSNNRISLRRTIVARAEEPEAGIALSAPINYTADNYMATSVAAIAMEEAISDAIASSGWTISSICRTTLFPDESLNMSIVLSKVDPRGLPASLASVDSADIVLNKARAAISRISAEGISPEGLETGKKTVMNFFDSWKGDPQTIGTLLALRYSYGKDIFSNYEGKIAAVDAERVNPILKDLATGGIAEYVVRKKDRKDFTEAPVASLYMPEIPELLPAEGQLVYPFEGMTVPLDTIDIAELEFMPAFIPSPEVVLDIETMRLYKEASKDITMELEAILNEEDEEDCTEL